MDLISWHAINQSYIIHKNLPPDEQASCKKASTEWLMPLFTFDLALIHAKTTQGCEPCLNLRRRWCLIILIRVNDWWILGMMAFQRKCFGNLSWKRTPMWRWHSRHGRGIGSYVRTGFIRAKTQLPWTQMSSKDDLITELNTAAVVMSGRYELTEALAS